MITNLSHATLSFSRWRSLIKQAYSVTVCFSVFIVVCALTVFSHHVFADSSRVRCIKHNVLVSNTEELQKELKKACAGSVIRLREGVWDKLAVTVKRSGNEHALLTVKADKPGKTFIEGKSYIVLAGNYIRLEGLYFRHGKAGHNNGAIVVKGSHNLITENTLDGLNGSSQKDSWLNVFGQYNEISFNRFTNKTKQGVILVVIRNDASAQYHHIHHNHFENFSSGKGENGWETVRIGTSTKSQSNSFTLLENNRFDRCDGEVEIVSVKSGKNTIRGNTFVDSQGFVTLRHGKDNLVESNVFLLKGKPDGGGVRIYDSGHVIRNNYISGVRTESGGRGGIVFSSGDNAPGGEFPALNAHWTPHDIEVSGNTLYDSDNSFIFPYKVGNYPIYNVKISNNVIVPSKGNAAIFANVKPTNVTFEKEWYAGLKQFSGKANDFDIPEGIRFVDVTLTENPQGVFLHSTAGAQNLTILEVKDVGPQTY